MNMYQYDFECFTGDCECLSHNGFLTRRGYEAATQRGVDKAEASRYLDRVSSVSAFETETERMIFNDGVIDEQFERFASSSERAGS